MAEFAAGLGEGYEGALTLVAHEEETPAGDAFVERVLAAGRAGRGTVQVVQFADATLAHLAPALHEATGAPVVVSILGDDLPRGDVEALARLGEALRAPGVTVVASCATVAAEITARLRLSPRVIHPGVDTRFWGPVSSSREHVEEFRGRLGLPLDGRLVLSAGPITERSGIEWFAREVLPRLPEDVRYVVASDGPPAALESLGSLPRVVRSEVHLRNETAALFYASDLLVLPNLPNPEAPSGYRMDAARASATGLPVLLADIEGCADTAANLGLRTAAPGDAAAWAITVDTMLARRDGPTRVAEPWVLVAYHYLQLYREVAGLPA
ncbi:MAG: hypothetical protein AMXMBFR23_11010 [Chloroflexota bacterium]